MLTHHVIDYINASVKFYTVKSWGYRDNQTGEWSGMVGQLIRNEVDIGATSLFMTEDRIEYIDFIAMISPTGSRFVFRSPKLSYTDNVFILPFDSLVWYSLLGLVFVTAVCLLISLIAEWRIPLMQPVNCILKHICFVVFNVYITHI